MHDFRFAVRTLRRKPLFTLLVVVTLALGIGANTTIFSLLHQTLLRPLPYAEAERLVFVWNTYPLMWRLDTGLSRSEGSGLGDRRRDAVYRSESESG